MSRSAIAIAPVRRLVFVLTQREKNTARWEHPAEQRARSVNEAALLAARACGYRAQAAAWQARSDLIAAEAGIEPFTALSVGDLEAMTAVATPMRGSENRYHQAIKAARSGGEEVGLSASAA